MHGKGGFSWKMCASFVLSEQNVFFSAFCLFWSSFRIFSSDGKEIQGWFLTHLAFLLSPSAVFHLSAWCRWRIGLIMMKEKFWRSCLIMVKERFWRTGLIVVKERFTAEQGWDKNERLREMCPNKIWVWRQGAWKRGLECGPAVDLFLL